jgi:hypothetical protein
MLLNHRKDKLSLEMFTTQIHYKLDLTPIIAQQESDIDLIG